MAYIVYKNGSNYVLTQQVGSSTSVLNPDRVLENQPNYVVSTIKKQVRLCSTVPINLLVATTSLDGVTLANGDRVLLAAQTSPPENGLYFWDEGLQLFSRSEDGWDLPTGFLVSVTEGVSENDTLWMFITDGSIEIGTTPLNFVRIASESTHGPSHLYGGMDPIDGDLLGIDYLPTNYIRDPVGLASDVHHLTAHLTGMDTVLAGAGASHALSHISGSLDQIDGDILDITYSPTNYTQSIVAEVTTTEHLTAHLAGIDALLVPHALTHISGAGDEIDGDILDIDYTPTNYTPDTAPAEVTTAQQLTAHLAGINTALSHAINHISGGVDQIDGDILDITYTPTNYTPDTAPAEVTTTQHLTAHLAGIGPVLTPFSTHLVASDEFIDGVSLMKPLGQFAFDPTQYGTGRGFQFEVVMKVNNVAKTATALLYNLTDLETVTGTTVTVIGLLDFTKATSALIMAGAGAGDLKNSEKIYEVRLSIDGTVAGDLAYLGSAVIRILPV